MKIITTGAKEQLLARIQCLRDVGGVYDDQVNDLIDQRAICCDGPIVSPLRFYNLAPVQFSNNANAEWS